MTIYWTAEPVFNPSAAAIVEAAALLRQGKRVAFPTETVYGLGADARSTDAVQGIFTAKGRPSDNPLIVHIADRSHLHDLTDRADETSCRLMDHYWPGPLTVVLPVKSGAVSPLVTAGLATVGVRMPDHPVALSLIQAAGCPVAAPSANRSGRPSPTRAEHVREDLDELIEGVLDGGPTGVGLESTVVQVQSGIVHVLRPGGISREQLEQAGFRVDLQEAGPEWKEQAATPKAPGMKYTHYAPKGSMTVVRGADRARIRDWIIAALERASGEGHTTGVLTFDEFAADYRADLVLSYGRADDLGEAAHRLYAALRGFDEAGITFIAAEACREVGIGYAVMNRLLKAAGNRQVEL